MKRRDFLRSAGAAMWAQPARPNVLFVVVDDLDCRIGCYGDPVAKTPNIDRLAARGVRFERAYCQYPLCNPTRSSVLSGRYPLNTKVLDNNTWLVLEPGQQILPRYFESNGYQTAEFGKIWHPPNRGHVRGDQPPQLPAPAAGRATQQWFTPAERARQQDQNPAYWDNIHSPYRNMQVPAPWTYAWANVYGPLPDGDPGVDAPIADRAIATLEQMAAGGKPFFLSVGFHRPHVPLTAPKKYFDLFDPAEMPLPADFDTEPRAIPGVPRDEFRQNIDLFAARSFSAQEAREAMRAYYACSAYMDEQLGRVLDKLDALGQRDNTIIVFWGDHGWHLSEKGMWAKGTLFETSARGPLLICDPRKTKGKPSKRVVQYLDLFPTLTDLCGLPKPAWAQGTSLRPLLENPEARWDRVAYTVQARNWFIGRSVRDERWRYTEWDEGRRGSALYDHDSDPHEMRNVATNPAHTAVVARMKKMLRAPEFNGH
ncbi:MAG: sulfatase [Bryobacteraceae bacterium]